MTVITCHSCRKLQPFMERMMYCSFCGTHYTDLEIHNASQRIRQYAVMKKYSIAYLFGCMLLVLLVIPPLLIKLVPDLVARQNLWFLSIIVLFLIWANKPFAGAHAKKLYPEKSAE